ncbi:ABC-type nitrate/sulfonate/bicarbonate transport system ATPase subunit [Thermocatellispora tengchongensis]|uniref:ABC-type nitrate/sulfonate/bicarbonate transport system ATPase subunit n=1 Tax=Thermocatellispora tengchongensis TaxID=1073253 RepID=A0A840PLG4_9ACTN|nr:ABC transporter ATP-binding protein [Thermocatellispora tengchongensis]MBB5139756.1 ABC-type nitrate/sulfonate/bicarbonate transport system ATPase subunit [Thermocatellispora tengchongensis]
MPSPASDRATGATGATGTVGTSGTAISLSGVTQVYRGRGRGREVAALGPVDLELAAGAFLTVVGPSGCGKSTLLRLVAGFAAPTTGTIRAGGAPVTGPDPSRGFVFQQPRLFPWLSVAGNVGFGLRGRPRDERRARVAELLDLTGLADVARLRPYELSGGMQQRAAIARALAPGPDVLLMDEPFAALDAFTRERMQDEVRELWRRTGATIVFITHSVDEAVYLGTRVIALSSRPGRIVFDRSSELPALDRPRADPRFAELREELAEVIKNSARQSRNGPVTS